jgi:imidazolonepropionase-like amidohydrolase
MRLILTHANVIDCVTPHAIPNASVTIQDGRIVEVQEGQVTLDTREAEVIDLEGAYLLPGLWDVHIHPDYVGSPGPSVVEQTVQFGHRLMACLTEAGVVGVRCAGAAHFMDVAWKRAFDAGDYIGPRVFACGYFLTTTGGHFLTSGHARECDGPYGFVQAIREQMKQGVDHIKLNLSGGIMGPSWDRHWHSFLLRDELEAAFAICRQRDYKVMAHATNPEAVKAAIQLGAHSVEHGYIMDQACLDLFLEHDVWYVPTLAISHLTPDQASDRWERQWVAQRGLATDLCYRAEAASDEHRTGFQRALAAGVKMALGSDIRPLRDAALLEIGLWVKDGATPWQTLLAATKHAAELCGVGGDLGTIEAGKLADLIVVADNPLDDIHHLRRLLLVFKEGRIVSDKRHEWQTG